MPNSLRCMISKLKFQGKISELECEELLKKLDNHDKELIKKQEREEIKEEIEQELVGYPPSSDYYKAIMKCLQIIDKHIK